MDQQFTHAMVDIETGGTDPARNPVIQIAAVKFNIHTREVSSDFFDMVLNPKDQPNRFWDENTLEWWLKRKDVLIELMKRSQDTKPVLQSFSHWAEWGKLELVGKPTHFDWSFLSALYRDYGLQSPFGYRKAVNMRSFIEGRYYPDAAPEWEKIIEFQGKEHDALSDCLHQLKVFYKALDREVPSV